jgi:hypothetical protein
MCFNCNEVGHYSKNCPKPKLENGGFKVIAFITNLTQNELLPYLLKREGL